MGNFWEKKNFWFGLLALVTAVAGPYGYKDYTPTEEVEEAAAFIRVVVKLVLRLLKEEK